MLFCTKCGNEVSEDEKFCGKCGTPVEVKQEEIITEENTETLEEAETLENEEPLLEAEAMPAPKKKIKLPKKLLITAAAIVVPVIIVAAVIISNLGAIGGFFVKTFASDSTYMRYVEQNTFKNYADTVSSVYGNLLLDKISDDSKIEAELSAKIGKDFDELIESAGLDFETDWLKEAKVELTVNSKDEKAEVIAGLKIKKTEIATIAFYLDSEAGTVYAGIPEVNKDYIEADMGMFTGGVDAESVTMVFDLVELLPGEKDVNKILNNYIEIIAKCVNDVESEKTFIDADGIRQNCTMLTLDVDQRLVAEIGIAVLKELKSDKDIEKIVDRILDFMEEQGLYELDLRYQDLADSLDDAIAELEDGLDELDGDGEVLAVIKDYVNGSSEIIGRKIEIADEEVFFFATAKEGSNVGFEVEVADMFYIKGQGKDRNGKITGKYDIGFEDIEVKVEVEDFNTKKLEGGYINGTFRISVGDLINNVYYGSKSESSGDYEPYIDSQMSVSAVGMVGSILDTVEITIESSKDKLSLEVSIINEDEMLVSVKLDIKAKGGSKVKLPKDTVDAQDSDALNDWVGDMDFDKVASNLEKAGVPDELVELLTSSVDDLF